MSDGRLVLVTGATGQQGDRLHADSLRADSASEESRETLNPVPRANSWGWALRWCVRSSPTRGHSPRRSAG